MSRAPRKPQAQKAPELNAGAPKCNPSKRAPKRAVAVAAGAVEAPVYSRTGVTDDEMRQLANDPRISLDGRVWATERLAERVKKRRPVIAPPRKTHDDLRIAQEQLAQAETMAPGHVSARAKPKSSRERMLEAQKALQEKYKAADQSAGHTQFSESLARGDVLRKGAMTEWEDTHFPKDYATENAEARRRANRDTAVYAFIVFGIIAVVCVYVFWWSWK